MPRDIETFTHCAAPGIALSHRQLQGLTGILISAFYEHPYLTGGLTVGFIVALAALQSNLAFAAFILYVIQELDVRVKDWYYNRRLLCIRDKECAIGTVIERPEVSFDGDRKLNLLLAPFSHKDSIEALRQHIDENEAMLNDPNNFNDPPFHTVNPALPDQMPRNNDPQILKRYLKALKGKDDHNPDAHSRMYGQLLVGVIDRLLSQTTPAGQKKNFYQRFFRKDTDHIASGSSLWKAIPDDYDPTVSWRSPGAQSDLLQVNPYERGTASFVQSLNPMFKFDIEHLVPFMHCEIEGDAFALFIDDLIFALWVMLIAYFFLSPLLGPFAPLGALFIAAFLFIFKRAFEDWFQRRREADEPDLDWDDPDFTGHPGVMGDGGDVIAVYGAWIMDTEHNQFFEIHPVRAYYILSKKSMGDVFLTDENVGPTFDPTQVDEAHAKKLCEEITPVEEEDPPVTIEQHLHTLLSYGMTTQYAGGGAAVPII